MIRPYIIDPLESSSIHLDLTLVQSGILSRLVNLYFLFGGPFSFGQALSQISVDENLSTTEELERVLGWYFNEDGNGLYRIVVIIPARSQPRSHYTQQQYLQ